MKFDVNVGKTDSMIRIGVGGLLVLMALTGFVGAWGWIGVLPIVTGVMKTCPAYSVLKMNTCEKA